MLERPNPALPPGWWSPVKRLNLQEPRSMWGLRRLALRSTAIRTTGARAVLHSLWARPWALQQAFAPAWRNPEQRLRALGRPPAIVQTEMIEQFS